MLSPLIARLQAAADLNEVATAAEVSRKTLMRIMARENSPTIATAERISKALDSLKVPRKPAKAEA